MKEDYILLKFSLVYPVSFWIGSYVDDIEIGLFEVVDTQKPKYNTRTGGYDYELRLDAYYWKWKNKIFKYTPETPGYEASWNLTAPLEVHLSIFLRNLTALGYTYRGQGFTFDYDASIITGSKLISYNNTNMIDALTKMAEAWSCEWWVEDNVIHFGRCEYGQPVELSLDSNVADMLAQESKNVYATRIYAFGSTRNLPINYRPVDESIVVNGVVQKRLMLPEGIPYIDAVPGLRTEEAIEQVVIFDNVYPKTNGKISSISTYTDIVLDKDGEEYTETFYRFADSGFRFSEEYILPNEELRIVFQSGKLNGMDFGVKFNPEAAPEKLEDGSWNPDAQLFEIVVNENYGRRLPGGSLIPETGDTYILYGWDSTKLADLGLIDAAQEELKAEAEKYIRQSQIDPNTYTCKMMSDWVKEVGTTTQGKFLNPLTVGDRVTLVNKVYFKGGSRTSRIIGIEYNLDIPYDNPIYTVGESTAYSRIGELEKSVEELTVAGQTFIGNSGSSIYVIGTTDTTTPSNRNVFSSLRSLKQFLNKQAPDRTPFDLAVGGSFTAERGVQFGPSFADGVTGFGGMIDENGDGWLGGLHLRSFLEAPEYRYNRVELQIGNYWRAPGGGIVESVVPDMAADGTVMPTGTLTLHLEEGEIGTVAIDDICQGIFHDEVDLAQNASADYDDGRGNFRFAGFHTVYFRITDIVETGRNSVVRYALRPVSERWAYSFHPSAMMHFVGYGNFTNKDRQSSRYSTRTYERYLTGVNTWEFTDANIGAQFGDLSNLSVFGLEMQGYSAYLNNIYMSGRIKQFEALPLRMEIDTQGDTTMAWGERLPVVCTVWRGFDELTQQVTGWTVSRDTGVPQDDLAWSFKQKVKDFAGKIILSFDETENDLGNPVAGITTLFTFTAEIGPGEQAVMELALG